MGYEIFGVLEMGMANVITFNKWGKKKFLFVLKILPPLSPALKMTAPLEASINNSLFPYNTFCLSSAADFARSKDGQVCCLVRYLKARPSGF